MTVYTTNPKNKTLLGKLDTVTGTLNISMWLCSDSIQFLILVFSVHIVWRYPSLFCKPSPGVTLTAIALFYPFSTTYHRVIPNNFIFFTLVLFFPYLTESLRLPLRLYCLLCSICVTYGTPCNASDYQILPISFAGS